MAMNLFFIIFVLYSLILYESVEAAKAQQYTARVIEFKSCKGPKRNNCTVVTLTAPNDYTLMYDIDVKQNVILTHGKVIGKSVKGKKDIPLQMKKPCDHFLVRQTLETFFKVNPNCLLQKKHYVFSVNLKELINVNSYLSEYSSGEWIYSTMFFGNDCNVLCSNLHIKIFPVT